MNLPPHGAFIEDNGTATFISHNLDRQNNTVGIVQHDAFYSKYGTAASAATFVPPKTNVVYVTGTTNITSIGASSSIK